MEGDTLSGIGHEMRVLLTHFLLADVLVEVTHRVTAQQRKQLRLRQLIPEHLEPNRGRGPAGLPEDVDRVDDDQVARRFRPRDVETVRGERLRDGGHK